MVLNAGEHTQLVCYRLAIVIQCKWLLGHLDKLDHEIANYIRISQDEAVCGCGRAVCKRASALVENSRQLIESYYREVEGRMLMINVEARLQIMHVRGILVTRMCRARGIPREVQDRILAMLMLDERTAVHPLQPLMRRYDVCCFGLSARLSVRQLVMRLSGKGQGDGVCTFTSADALLRRVCTVGVRRLTRTSVP